MAGPQAWMAEPQTWLDGPEGGTDERTDGRTNKQTENLPILQDFVPFINSTFIRLTLQVLG